MNSWNIVGKLKSFSVAPAAEGKSRLFLAVHTLDDELVAVELRGKTAEEVKEALRVGMWVTASGRATAKKLAKNQGEDVMTMIGKSIGWLSTLADALEEPSSPAAKETKEAPAKSPPAGLRPPATKAAPAPPPEPTGPPEADDNGCPW